jgi:hypothetical protein
MTRNSRVADLLRLRLRSNDSPVTGGPIQEMGRKSRLSQAANGTSYGRRRGPVPRQITPIEPSSETNGSTLNGAEHNGVAHNGAAHNGKKTVTAQVKKAVKPVVRGRSPKAVLTA